MKKTPVIILAALLLSLSWAGVCSAQGVSVGVVSMREVLTVSAYVQQVKEQLNRLVKQKNADLEARRLAAFVNYLLTEAELREGQALLAKTSRTPQEEARLTALRTASNARDADWLRLQQKPAADLTAEEKQRLAELEQLRQAQSARADEVNKLLAQFQEEVDQAQRQAEEAWQTKFEQVVTQIAKQKNLTLVLDADSVYYFDDSLSITQEVIAALDSGEPPTPH